MKNKNTKVVLIAGIIVGLIICFFSFFLCLTPINLRSIGFWLTILMIVIAVSLVRILATKGAMDPQTVIKSMMAPIVVFLFIVAAVLSGASIFHASQYASILNIEDAVFEEDLAETLTTDSIALMDTASAQKLGDREIGTLSDVVSQYNVSESYTQIDYNGSPKKVSALMYAGFFKWLSNKAEGVPGYVVVDPVSMSASYTECEEGMIYVPSAYFLQNAARHIYLQYPTLLTDNVHFEIDEDGNPYYVTTVYKRTIGLFDGQVVDGVIILDPVTGETVRYAVEDVPTWVDVVYDGDLICTYYNWKGELQNGYLNSLFAKKGCSQVTTYTTTDENDSAPSADYGYVAKDGDIWIYTGITSVNDDSSNIGFILANERTGETHYYTIAGADEKSAMAAAEGEVQEKGYQASFPSLINVDGNPTYIMVLKDDSGLVKMYATVNVEQYNIVTTATTQEECIRKYKSMLGIETEEEETETEEAVTETAETTEPAELVATGEATIVISDIKYIDIDGNTYLYFIDENAEIYKAKVADHEELLLLAVGDTVEISYTDDHEIVTCARAE